MASVRHAASQRAVLKGSPCVLTRIETSTVPGSHRVYICRVLVLGVLGVRHVVAIPASISYKQLLGFGDFAFHDTHGSTGI
jgi:hypothetical protein